MTLSKLSLKANYYYCNYYFKRRISFYKFGEMSSGKDHMQITANQNREKLLFDATVIRSEMMSNTVKAVSLTVQDSRFRFKSGQWLDFFVPSLANSVGGYSICSSEEKLRNEGLVDLAVKRSDYPTAQWIHQKCEVGNVVKIRVGGEMFYDPEANDDLSHDLLLIAGGVGVNPVVSVLQHADHLTRKGSTKSPSNLYLLYSAKSIEELIFRELITSLCEKQDGKFKCQFFITGENESLPENIPYLRKGRITETDILETVSCLPSSRKIVYLCGPNSMLVSIEKTLKDSDHSANLIIRSEKWW